jgi:hypothetical protein
MFTYSIPSDDGDAGKFVLSNRPTTMGESMSDLCARGAHPTPAQLSLSDIVCDNLNGTR